MKKKCLLPIMMAAVIMSAATGCSSGKEMEPAASAEEEIVEMEETEAPEIAGTEEMSGEEEADGSQQSVLTGTIDEIKDFMFVVVDDEGRAFALSYEGDKPEGLDKVTVGDKVKVTYTGELSEVDHFDGEIISVEKAE